MSDKETVLKNVETEYENLQEAVKGLDAGQIAEDWLEGCASRATLVHVLGWERPVLTLLASRRR